MTAKPTLKQIRQLPGQMAGRRPRWPNIDEIKANRRLSRRLLIIGNIALLVLVAGFVLANRSASQTIRSSSLSSPGASAAATANPLDQLSSAEIAAQAASLLEPGILQPWVPKTPIQMPEVTAVRNQADSENALMSVVPNASSVVAKPQIVTTAQKSRKNIIHYATQAGDTVTTLALKFGISANALRWSNNLSGENIAAGQDLLIPPAEGIVYKVKAGDSVESVVSKYQADRSLFVTVNDAESGNLPVDDLVWIPNGLLPSAPRINYTSYYAGPAVAAGGYNAVYAGNGYDYGYCTWWTAYRRAQTGRPVPSNLGNAVTWKVLSQQAGLSTGPTPQVGAVAWKNSGYPGHVAYVEEVYADGSAKISEMNVVRWNVTSTQIISPEQLGSYYFIY